MEEKGVHIDTKTSAFSLATTKHEDKVKIVSYIIVSMKMWTKLLKNFQTSNHSGQHLVQTKTESMKEKWDKLVRFTIILQIKESWWDI